MNISEQINASETILFDASRLDSLDPSLFRPQFDNNNVIRLGRGTVYLFNYGSMSVVLRHYCRGGMVRHLIRDSYFYTGLDETRMWREFHLLQLLQEKGLPVPTPLAVRCVKTSLFSYRGDIVTEVIPQAQTLAQCLQEHELTPELWGSLGTVLASFHSAGVYHADLNANNIMLDNERRFYLIDFDRGELRSPDKGTLWAERNLQRLERSLRKLSVKHPVFHFLEHDWKALNDAYTASN